MSCCIGRQLGVASVGAGDEPALFSPPLLEDRIFHVGVPGGAKDAAGRIEEGAPPPRMHAWTYSKPTASLMFETKKLLVSQALAFLRLDQH